MNKLTDKQRKHIAKLIQDEVISTLKTAKGVVPRTFYETAAFNATIKIEKYLKRIYIKNLKEQNQIFYEYMADL